ncbi:hypothetical protein [Rhodococcus sp. USK13]|nr:hypothetical protein [Rhodococcus sp. USK13]
MTDQDATLDLLQLLYPLTALSRSEGADDLTTLAAEGLSAANFGLPLFDE